MSAFFFVLFALIFQIVNASPVSTEEVNINLNKRNVDLHLRDVAEEPEALTLVKRGHHHRWGGFGKHGFGFGGWHHHRGRFW